MAATGLSWVVEDAAGKRGFAGVTIPLAKDIAAAETFVAAAIAPYSDAGLNEQAVKSSSATNAGDSTGDADSARRGTVLIENKETKQRFAVSIPAIGQAHIVSNPKGQNYLTDAVCDAVLAAFETLTGFTNCSVTSSFVQDKR